MVSVPQKANELMRNFRLLQLTLAVMVSFRHKITEGRRKDPNQWSKKKIALEISKLSNIYRYGSEGYKLRSKTISAFVGLKTAYKKKRTRSVERDICAAMKSVHLANAQINNYLKKIPNGFEGIFSSLDSIRFKGFDAAVTKDPGLTFLLPYNIDANVLYTKYAKHFFNMF